jgi:hypothetical protein
VLEALAAARHATVLEVLKQFIRLGLYVSKATQAPDTAVVLRAGGRERELLLL